MERLLLADGQIMDFEILTQRMIADCFDANMVLYFVLDKEAEISVEEKRITLKEHDFLLVDSYRQHTYRAASGGLAARFVINAQEASRYYDTARLRLVCNSTTSPEAGEGQERYVTLRRLLESCISYYYGKRAGDGRSLMRLSSVYYQILEQLVTYFSEYMSSEDEHGSDQERIQGIISYIHNNYHRQISLNDLADQMYLSTAYISRYIKKKLGKNFGEYLTELRLGYAVQELQYADKTIARIALDNGFPNVTAFNKAFKGAYEMTPKVYQENYLRQRKEEGAGGEKAENIDYRLLGYLDRQGEGPGTAQRPDEIAKPLSVDTKQYRYLFRNWSRMMNVGCVVELLRSDVQEHILYLKETLKVEYFRIWDLYDERLQLNAGDPEGKHNYIKLDKALDFLVNHQIRPYVELGFKPIIIRDTYETYISHEERELLFTRQEDYRSFLEHLMIHFVNRYGTREVSQWYFEQWCDPRLFPEGDPQEYLNTLETAYSTIKSISPETKIGGAYDRSFGVIDYHRLMECWGKRSVQPDFVSVYCYGSVDRILPENEQLGWRETSKQNGLYGYLKYLKNVMKESGMTMPVNISEWNLTVVNKNVFNDSCFKGAYVMKNLMQLYPEVELAGYWFGTDLFVEYQEPKVLNGYCGLLTYHGICKPAFYAIEFMNRLCNFLLGQTDRMMVTMDGYDNYVIVCHNYRNLGAQYYAQDEKSIEIDKIPLLCEDEARLKLSVRINHIRNGFYYIKTRSISSKNGSVQDEWRNMGLIENFNAQDIEYLRRISTPKITVCEYYVCNETLELTMMLEPHEIQCIHIYRQIKE